MTEIAFVLGIPLLGGIVLAFSGGWRQAALINVLFSLAAFVSAVLLTIRVVGEGSFTAFQSHFFVDSFNVVLVALTAFVALTTSLFSRPYMLNEQLHGKLNAGMLRLYH